MKMDARDIAERVSRAGGAVLDSISDLTGVRGVLDPLPHPKGPRSKSLHIPGYKQVQSSTCGFIAAANVLHFFSRAADLKHLYSRLDSTEGTTEFQVAAALRSYGVGVRKRSTLDFNGICKSILAGAPVICPIKATFHGHWVVAYGYDRVRSTVFICGNGSMPLLNRKEVEYARFCERWDPKGHGLVCTPGRRRKPRSRRSVGRVRIVGIPRQ